MKSLIGLSIISMLLIIPACQQSQKGKSKNETAVKDSSIIGHWYERISDRKRFQVSDLATGRELLDNFYPLKKAMDSTYRHGGSALIVLLEVDFDDSVAQFNSPCILWHDLTDRTSGNVMLIVDRSRIVSKGRFDRDYIKIK